MPGKTSEIQYREDFGGDISSRIDENGYLRIEGIAAKVGVMTYMQGDGTVIREYVPPETLFDEKSMGSLIGSPATNDHPPVTLNADNAEKFSRGSVPSVKRDGDKLSTSIVITSKSAIADIQKGKRQLSPGYRVQLKYEPGEVDGVKYDAIQTARVYNHLAVVPSARGGPECKINFDGKAISLDKPTEEVKKMATLKLASGATVEVEDASTATAIQAELNTLKARADEADGMVKKSDYDALKGKYDALESKLAEMEKDSKMDSAQIGEYVELTANAKLLKSDIEMKQDGQYLAPRDLMIKALGIEGKDHSDEYIKGRFDAAVSLASEKNIAAQRSDGAPSQPVLSGRQKFMAEQINPKRGE